MRDSFPDDEMVGIADSSAPLHERGRAMLDLLNRCVMYDAAWLAVSDARLRARAVVASVGLDQTTSELLERGVSASSTTELSSFLGRGGDTFRGGIGAALSEPSGVQVGYVGLLQRSAEPPAVGTRQRLDQLAPAIAQGVSPMRSLLASARLVPEATTGVVLLLDGTTCVLPGLHDHALLRADSPAVRFATHGMPSGQVSRAFMWPTPAPGREHGHARLTVLCATDLADLVRGVLLLEPDADSRGMTSRELEVLGLLVDGRSNQEIARTFGVTPRTVATHVEHVMRKLEAPSRTLSAVLAEREGSFVPTLGPDDVVRLR